MEYVVAPLLKYEDHWDRDEWQDRGTEHNHGLLWIPDAPPMIQDTEGSRGDFASYWGERITAYNPNPSRPPDARNPASLAPADVANTPDQFAAFLNQCSAVITMGWMANTDIQPPTSLEAVLSYIAKYVSKPEKSSDSYLEMQARILPYVNDQAPLLSFVSKMLNKVIAERDWSA